jgi:hypothetical protein
MIGSNGVSFSVRDMFTDVENNLLFVAGQFATADTVITKGFGYWDGDNWHSLQPIDIFCDAIACNPITRVKIYDGEIFLSGQFYQEQWIKKWNGEFWENVGSPDGSAGLSLANNELFATGYFDTISGVFADGIARWTGDYWEAFGTPIGLPSGQVVTEVAFYNGHYYFGGNFLTINGIREITYWDGDEWNSLQNGLLGDAWVDCMVVYNNLLFVGGFFSSSSGNIATNLMAWDGENWINPFPGVDFYSQIYDMAVIDDKLYISGFSSLPDQCCIYAMGVYDGSEYCGFGGSVPYTELSSIGNAPRRIGSYNDDIVVAVGQSFFGQTTNRLASIPKDTPSEECISVLNTTASYSLQSNSTFLSIYPNPSTHTVYLSSPDITPGCFVRVYNLSGQLVYEQNVMEQSERLAIASSNIGPPGMYVVQLHSPGKAMAVQKLVVAE